MEELLPHINESGKVLSVHPRSEFHKGNLKMLHPVIHVHLFNSKGEIYLQKRPLNKLVQPGKWDTAVGGHVSFGEELDLALQREAEEEIGIKDFKPQLISKYKWETDVESELVFMFLTYSNQKLAINTEEVDEGRFWRIKDIQKNLGNGIFTPNFEMEFEILKKVLK